MVDPNFTTVGRFSRDLTDISNDIDVTASDGDTPAPAAGSAASTSDDDNADLAASGEVSVTQSTVSTQWWLFPPFGGPKFKTSPIIYNPNPLVVTRSGTYTVSVFFQKPGIQRISAINSLRRGRFTVRPLAVKVSGRVADWPTCFLIIATDA
jgi:hypothetical protein